MVDVSREPIQKSLIAIVQVPRLPVKICLPSCRIIKGQVDACPFVVGQSNLSLGQRLLTRYYHAVSQSLMTGTGISLGTDRIVLGISFLEVRLRIVVHHNALRLGRP